MVVSSSSSWAKTLLLSLCFLCCGLSAQAFDDGDTAPFRRRLRSSNRAATGGGRRHLQADEDGDTVPRVVMVRNIQLRVGNAPGLLSETEVGQLETVVENWFLDFYADPTRQNIAKVISTTVTFKSQEFVDEDSIILYNQAITYIPLSKDGENSNTVVTLPYGVLKYNALLSESLTKTIPAWADRPPGLFLVAPVVLGRIPSSAPTNAPTNAPTTKAPIAAPTGAPVDEPTEAPVTKKTTERPVLQEVFPMTDEPTMAPTIMPSLAVPVSSAPVVPTAAPTWSVVNVTLEEMELVYSNVDVIDPLQLEVIENVTEMWFNEYYNDKDNSTKDNATSSKRNEDEDETESNTTVTALFDFVSQDYNVTKKTMTVLFAVQLTYKGNPDDALAILQTPWQDASGVGTYRQLLVAEMPASFASVETTAPPQVRNIVVQPPPTKSVGKDKKYWGLSLGVIIGIAIIGVAVIVLLCVVVKMQCGVIARRRERNSNGGDKISPTGTAPYRPHVNEEEDSVLFPQAPAPHVGSSSHKNKNDKKQPVAAPPAAVSDASTAGGVSMPYARSDDHSYDGKSVDTTEFDYSKVGADSVRPMSAGFSSTGLSSATPSVASGQSSNLYNEASSDMLTPMDNEDQFVIYAPAGKLGLVVDNRDNGPPVIHSIKEDSVLIDQIQVGDRLVGVDEVDVRTLSPVRVSKLISKRSTNPLRKLTLTRRGKERGDDIMGDDTTAGGLSSYAAGMSRLSGSGVGTDTEDDDSALGQGFSDDDTSFVGSMSRVSGDGQSMDSSAVAMR